MANRYGTRNKEVLNFIYNDRKNTGKKVSIDEFKENAKENLASNVSSLNDAIRRLENKPGKNS